jgi:hypothetical protein
VSAGVPFFVGATADRAGNVNQIGHPRGLRPLLPSGMIVPQKRLVAY